MAEFNNKSRPRIKKDKDKKRENYESAYALYKGQELSLNAFKSGVFPIEATQGKGLKMLTPKQFLQRLSIALTQVKAVKLNLQM